MGDVTLLLAAAKSGEPGADERLWHAVYAELRRMAGQKMSHEKRQVTYQATVLVHEAWLKLAGPEGESPEWQNRGHFFSAAAEAMRRILVDQARRRLSAKRGSGAVHEPILDLPIAAPTPDEKLIQIHEVIDELAAIDPRQARIVKLRFFIGLTHEEIATLLDIGESSVRREWTLAKAWLFQAIKAANLSGLPPDPEN